jgi:uncharacterized protein YcfJ
MARSNLFDCIKCVLNYTGLRCRVRHQEITYTALGIVVGFFIGLLFVGGVGIAALGTAFGISGSFLFAGVGGLVGNRIGIGRDKKVLRKATSPLT